MPTGLFLRLKRNPLRCCFPVLAIIMTLYFAAVSVHQFYDGGHLDIQTSAASANSFAKVHANQGNAMPSGKCGVQSHCHYVAILTNAEPMADHSLAHRILPTGNFAKQSAPQFAAPPPKSA